MIRAVGLLVLLVGAAGHAELRLGVPTGEPAPTVAQLLAELDAQGEPFLVRSYQDVDQIVTALATGTLDLALLEEPAVPLAGISVLSEVYPSVLHVLYRSQHAAGPKSLADLLMAGAIYAGAPGGVGYQLVLSLAADYGLDASRVDLLEDAWTRDPDVYFIFGGLLAPDALARLNGFRLWSFDDPSLLMRGSAAEGLMLRYPNLRPFILPADLYPALGREPALTVSVSTVLVARDTLEVDRAFAALAAIDRAAPLIASAYPLAGLPQAAMGDTAARTLRLHPGALRYRNRNEPTFLERYAEVLALGFSLVIALGSASLALERRRRQARKDRLDLYFQRVLGERPTASASVEERRAANLAIRAIQAEVFDLVVAERIDADGALVAFLTLSNQALAETADV